jgi:hypothetical protein
MNEIICFKENCSKTRLSYWVVLQIELIKPVETVCVGLEHVSSDFN